MSQLQEGTIAGARDFLHLGSRAAVDQALSRLARRGRLLRAARGQYVRFIESRFGVRAPSPEKVIGSLKGETVVPHGAASANALGLTTQVPIRTIYLTSGPSRLLHLGRLIVELKHASGAQMIGGTAGDVIRALSWMGQNNSKARIEQLKRRLPGSVIEELVQSRSKMPSWMAQRVSELIA
jgi:hypothetical protein